MAVVSREEVNKILEKRVKSGERPFKFGGPGSF